MTTFPARVVLGRTGLSVGPLALSGGYGVDATSCHKAFERGVNYWYHGSAREPGMTTAIRELVKAGKRDGLVIVLQSYARWACFMESTLRRGLRTLGVDHADVLLLGWHNSAPAGAIMERAARLREQGVIRHIAVSSHHRPVFPVLAADPAFGVLHIRYNAAHAGAEQDVFPKMPANNRPGTVAYTATSWGQLLKASKMPPGQAPLRARDCYRFVLSNADFNVCMTGPRNAAELDEALAALEAGPLSKEEDDVVRRVGRHVHG